MGYSLSAKYLYVSNSEFGLEKLKLFEQNEESLTIELSLGPPTLDETREVGMLKPHHLKSERCLETSSQLFF